MRPVSPSEDPTRDDPSPTPLLHQEGAGRKGLPPGGGVVAGRYRLLQRIGEGGMGEVWLAEQSEPVRRQVAVKVIRAGMDTERIVDRFEAERQALALMDHPHIAKVLDAGATEAQRPYFVMEWVEGSPITTYCDQATLAVPARLELFQQVCRAVQHAPFGSERSILLVLGQLGDHFRQADDILATPDNGGGPFQPGETRSQRRSFRGPAGQAVLHHG